MGMQDSLFRRMSWAFSSLLNSRRNLYDVFGYSTYPTFDDRFLKYLRQDVAARVVDAPAAALWTNPPEISSTSEAWNTDWNDLVARHDLFSAIERADKLAGIGRFSIIIIGFNDGNGLEIPVNSRRLAQSDNKILFLQVYSEKSVIIETYNTDSSSERFNRPEMYRVQPDIERSLSFGSSNHNTSAGKLGSFRVHASRVLHVAENVLENDIFGLPRMERVYNVLDDLLKVTGGTAETFWLTANRGLHIDVDKDLSMEPGDEEALSDEVDEYTNNLRRVIRTRGVKVTALGSTSPDPTGTFKMLISCLSGATGIPSRILIGSEAGQLASEQDRANWAERVDERRANFANPMVLHQLIKMLTRVQYFTPEELIQVTINWPSAFKLSPLEAAQTAAQHARSATNFAKTIETMENLRRGEPGSEGQLDEEGNPIPGTETPEVPGADLEDLVTIEEARKFIGLDKPEVTFDSGADLGVPTKGRPRRRTERPVVNVQYTIKRGVL